MGEIAQKIYKLWKFLGPAAVQVAAGCDLNDYPERVLRGVLTNAEGLTADEQARTAESARIR